MPKAVGIAVRMTTAVPAARVAVLDGPATSPAVVETFTVTTSSTEPASQSHDIASGVRNRLHGLNADVVLVRRADRAPIPSGQEGRRVRLIVEGAIAAFAMDVVSNTLLLTGRDAAQRTTMNKDALDAQALAVSGAEYAEATAAAIAALS
jgi:hypothetical protein